MDRQRSRRMVGMVSVAFLAGLVSVACGGGNAQPTLTEGVVPTSTVAQKPTFTPAPIEPTAVPPPTSTSEPTSPPTLTPTESPSATPTAAATVRPTAAPATPTDTPQPPVSESGLSVIVADLQGLTLDAFFEASYRQLLLR